MHAAREKGRGLDHPLDVRVLAAIRLEQEPPGDFRIFLSELRAQLTEEGELAFVVAEQLLAHYFSRTWTSPVPIWSIVSNTIGSGAGSIRSCASIRKRTVRLPSSRSSNSTRTASSLGSKT